MSEEMKWGRREEYGVHFFLCNITSLPVRVECNGRMLGKLDGKAYCQYSFPAGIVDFKVFREHDYTKVKVGRCGFFYPDFRGLFLIGENEIFPFIEEEVTVLPEKGYFRVINLSEGKLDVRRIGGNKIFADISLGEATPYRLAGAGNYRLQFYLNNQKCGELSFIVKEGSKNTILFYEKELRLLNEFSI